MKRVEIVSPLLGRPILLLSYTVLSTLLAIIRHPLHSSSYYLSPLLLTSHLLHVIWHPLRSSSYHLSTSAPLVIIHHHLPLLSSLLSTHFAALLWTWKCFILLFFLLLPPLFLLPLRVFSIDQYTVSVHRYRCWYIPIWLGTSKYPIWDCSPWSNILLKICISLSFSISSKKVLFPYFPLSTLQI